MSNQLFKLSLFELKKNLLHSRNWLSSLIFLLINMAIIPFTIDPSRENLNQFFLPVMITSMLLGVVLITSHIFDEDAKDGSIEQYQLFGLEMYQIYLSKVVATIIEFCIIIGLLLPVGLIFYEMPIKLLLQLLIAILFFAPVFTSISVFGALLTANIKHNSALAILLIFPLLISILILLSLAAKQIILTGSLLSALPFIEINIGLTIILLPILCLLTKYLR